MVFNATFNNSSVLSWRSVLLVEEIRKPRENHRQTLSQNVASRIPCLSRIRTHNVSGGYFHEDNLIPLWKVYILLIL